MAFWQHVHDAYKLTGNIIIIVILIFCPKLGHFPLPNILIFSSKSWKVFV